MALGLVWLGCHPGGRLKTSPEPSSPQRTQGTAQLASLLGLALGQELLAGRAAWPWCLSCLPCTSKGLSPSLPPFLPRLRPSPWQAENCSLSSAHTLVTWQLWGVSGVSLVCREREEDEHGAAAHSGTHSSKAPAWPSLLWDA